MNGQHLLIAGGGPVGLVTALLLEPHFEAVTVLERHEGGMPSARSLQLVLGERGRHASERVLELLVHEESVKRLSTWSCNGWG